MLHHALVHAARGAAALPRSPLPRTRRRSNLGGLRTVSAAGGELPGGAGGAHPRAGTPGTAATGDHNLVRHAQRRNNAAPGTHPCGPSRSSRGTASASGRCRRVRWRPEAAPLPPPPPLPPSGARGRARAVMAAGLWPRTGCGCLPAAGVALLIHKKVSATGRLKCFSAWELKLCCLCVLSPSPLRGNAAV